MGRIPASILRLSILLLTSSAAALAQGAVSPVVGVDPASVHFMPASAGSDVIADADEERVPERGIIENEAAVVDVCAAYVEAQMIYLRSAHNSDGFLVFAQKIRSTPDRRDGLYWALDSSEDESPMGPLFAAAAVTEEQQAGESRPYFGYYFKILLSQGPEAVGGARDYRVDGRLIAGFALVAWPAEYGVSGVQSFLVNHLGDVYAKDLGSNTHRAAAGMSAFAPDRSWTKVVAGTDSR